MFERVKVYKINENVWLMNDNNEATGYVVIGEEKALVIDTMMGYENVKSIVETLTNKPIIVVNTHGHCDHIFGNVYFDQVYINLKDIELAEEHIAFEEYQRVLNGLGLKTAKFMPICDGDSIDLGGIKIDVIETPGHTPGGVCLLDSKNRILFTGDTIIEQTWMQLEESLPMSTLLESLTKIQKVRHKFDVVLTGHSKNSVEDASLCEAQLNAVKEICQGYNENDEEYEWFGGISKAHPYGSKTRKIVYK